MSSTKKVFLAGVEVTLYTVDGRNWFSSPISCIETRKHLNEEKESLKKQWREERKFTYELVPAGGDDCAGAINFGGSDGE